MAALAVPLGLVPLVLSAHIVDHVPEVVVALGVIRVCVDEVILGQFEDDGDEDEKFPQNLVE